MTAPTSQVVHEAVPEADDHDYCPKYGHGPTIGMVMVLDISYRVLSSQWPSLVNLLEVILEKGEKGEEKKAVPTHQRALPHGVQLI